MLTKCSQLNVNAAAASSSSSYFSASTAARVQYTRPPTHTSALTQTQTRAPTHTHTHTHTERHVQRAVCTQFNNIYVLFIMNLKNSHSGLGIMKICMENIF